MIVLGAPGRSRTRSTSPASVHECMRVWAAARRPGEIHVHAGRSDRSATMHCMCMPARAGTHRLRRCMGRANKLNACICMIETGQTHASSNQTGDYWRGRMQARANEAAGSRARPLSSHAAHAAAAAPSRNDAKRPGEVACARSRASARRALPCSLSHVRCAVYWPSWTGPHPHHRAAGQAASESARQPAAHHAVRPAHSGLRRGPAGLCPCMLGLQAKPPKRALLAAGRMLHRDRKAGDDL